MSVAHVIETEGLTKSFSGRTALRDFDLAVGEGLIYGVVGANGAGKSTLLRLLLGVIWPTRGVIKLFGRPLPREAAHIRQRVHYVGADGEVYKSFHVDDLVRYARHLYTKWDDQRANHLLDALELPRRASIRELSMGMKMQLRLAVALSTRPDILLLDEPTTGLDPVVKKQFLQLLLDEVAERGTTIVMATHQLDTLERIADGVSILYQGRCVANGLLEDFKQRIRSYQAVFTPETPREVVQRLAHDARVLSHEEHGSIQTFVVDDGDGAFGAQLPDFVTHVEQIPMDLESLFSYLLKREGYARETVLRA